MAPRVRNPAAVRLLLGWAVIAALTLGGLALLGIHPGGHPTLVRTFGFAIAALASQGVATMMAVRTGRVRLAWIILAAPQLLMLAIALLLLVLMVAT